MNRKRKQDRVPPVSIPQACEMFEKSCNCRYVVEPYRVVCVAGVAAARLRTLPRGHRGRRGVVLGAPEGGVPLCGPFRQRVRRCVALGPGRPGIKVYGERTATARTQRGRNPPSLRQAWRRIRRSLHYVAGRRFLAVPPAPASAGAGCRPRNFCGSPSLTPDDSVRSSGAFSLSHPLAWMGTTW